MNLKTYSSMTYHIYNSLNIIKGIEEIPELDDSDYIQFKFKKPGFTKLLIFDLDETLIHCHREEYDDEEENDE